MTANNNLCVLSSDGVLADIIKRPFKSAGFHTIVCTSVEQVLETCGHDKPVGCIVADLRGGLDTLKELAQGNCVAPVVLFGASATVGGAVQAIKAGAFDVVDKIDALADSVKKAIAALLKYQCLFDERARAAARIASLTKRETQVLNLMVQGKPNRQIADELDISTKTLDIHRSNLMEKMAAKTAAQLYRAFLLHKTNPVWLPVLFG